MSDRSAIEWCDASWNPIRARLLETGKIGWDCVRVSPGCVHCYAAAINHRRGTGEDYTVPALARVESFLDEAMLRLPLRWARPRRIFVCSMTDVFGEWIPDKWIDSVFAMMALAPRHTFLVLTKRAARMRSWFTDRVGLETRGEEVSRIAAHHGSVVWNGRGTALNLYTGPVTRQRIANRRPWPGWPLPNVSLGVSVEDRAHLGRLDDLRATPAASRFVSFEPLLEDLGDVDLTGIDQAIYGGESGPRARACEIEWIRRGIACCRKSGTAAFVKQVGARPVIPAVDPALRGPAVVEAQRAIDMEWPAGTHFGNPTGRPELNGRVALLRHPKGGDPSEWPEDLRVREWPAVKEAP